MTDDTSARCTDDVCITCSDVAVPVRVVKLLPGELALVEVEGREEEVSVALVSASVGDTLLVHAGEAIASVEREAP
ncbi:MAG TPA: HypC/HybG/HupF family hydrogenase formation chaperone [Acidimicrobiia bacterium]|nr:HypC/HybG/HupF family hydrogenase formation chaperone [Acidimicrobiia bacterium]